MLKLFVGGFPLDYTEVDLAKLILPFGNISTIKIVRDKQSKKCKGYAFVVMINDDDALQAVQELNNTELSGRMLTLKVVEEPPFRTKELKQTEPTIVPAKTYQKLTRSPEVDVPSRVLRPRRNKI